MRAQLYNNKRGKLTVLYQNCRLMPNRSLFDFKELILHLKDLPDGAYLAGQRWQKRALSESP